MKGDNQNISYTHQTLSQDALQRYKVGIWHLCQGLQQNEGCNHLVHTGWSKLVQLQEGQVGLKIVTVPLGLELYIAFKGGNDFRVVPTVLVHGQPFKKHILAQR